MTTLHFCDPAWHDKRTDVPADYLIQPMPEDREVFLNGYATCRYHLDVALSIMLERLGKVSVRRVNKR
jgi:hypothetical protein